MLVLSRKNQESVVIVDPRDNECLIKITLIEIRGRRVRLGIEAAEHVPIRRAELRKHAHIDGPPSNNVHDGPVVRSEAMDRWEDDGGETDLNRSANDAPEAPP